MIVFLHVLIAISSVAFASYAYARPSTSILRGSYAMVAMTLASGFLLVWTTPSHMIQACMSGVAYLTVVVAVTVLARRKLSVMQTDL